VTVDESGIYYWAVDEGEFRCMDHDVSNRSVILRGGDIFNYSDGNLYSTEIYKQMGETLYNADVEKNE